MAKGNIYVGVTGLVIDIPMLDGNGRIVPYDVVSFCQLHVLEPGKLEVDEVIWPATSVEPNFIRHVVPETTVIVSGKYKIQPYIETLTGFKGFIDPVELTIYNKYKR